MKKIITKENILIFLLILFTSIALCFDFLKPHFTIDTYLLTSDDFYVYAKYAFLPIGRIIPTLLFYTFFYLNMEFGFATVLSSFIGIIIAALSVFIIYYSFIKYFKNTLFTKIFILLLSFLSIFNFSTIELFSYTEALAMCLGILCSILASIIFVSNIKYKYIYSQILIIFSALSYQSTLCIFITLTIFHLFIQTINLSKNFRKILLSFVQYGISVIIDFLLIELLIKMPTMSLYKISFELTLESILNTFFFFNKCLLVNGLYVIPPFSYLIIICLLLLFIILLINKEKKSINHLINYIIIIAISYFFTLLPLLSMEPSTLYSAPRMFIGTTMLIPFSVIYILYYFPKNKFINKTFLVSTIILFCINFVFFHHSTQSMLLSNKIDKQLTYHILDAIKNYEEKTNQTVVYIATVYDSSPTLKYKNTYGPLSSRALHSEWSIYAILSYYGDRDFMKTTNINQDIYNMYFLNENWNDFSNEQLVFYEDTLYICVY